MNWNKSFQRKVIYIALMALLLVPLSCISRPATPGPNPDEGGILARKRTEYNLSQAELGEIDPASETMKLALLGMRGVAANILWTKANHYKKTEQWPKLMATVEQITNLQPNFISVWQFQAWNVSYNVSVEFDNYLHRYFWVKRGIRFLIDGTRYNRDEPRLLWDIGWFFGQKLGRSDEYKQFRREFRSDEEFHRFLRPLVDGFDDDCIGAFNGPDNWLVSHKWFRKAQDSVISGRATLRGRALQSIFDEKPSDRKKGKSPVLFHSNPAMALINYAGAIQEEGVFDEKAMEAWRVANEVWTNYGNREIRTSRDFYIRLNEAEQLEEEVAELLVEFDGLLSGVRNTLTEEKRATLSADELLALDTPVKDRNPDQFRLAREAELKIRVSPVEMAEVTPGPLKDQARWMATEIMDKQQRADFVRRYRQIVNFDYWRTRCEVEQLEQANAAHKHMYRADELYRDAYLQDAKENYELAWIAWAEIYQQYPQLKEEVGAEDVVDAVKRYASLLGQLDAPFPADFKLKEIIQYHDRSFHPWGEDESQESSNPGAGTPNESPTPLEAPTEDSSSEEPTATDGENPDDGNTTDEG
ncbi:MAG: hypothetical protein MK179_12710 [Pirellulaceae bacterium]|nr:hypothetical protein [Pirellulaceae bacterium]